MAELLRNHIPDVRVQSYDEQRLEIKRLRSFAKSENKYVQELLVGLVRLREAAELFRDFGDFQHLHRPGDLEQVAKARKLLKPEGDDES